MPWNDVFNSGVIYPSQTTYLSIALAANQTLEWPIEQQSGTAFVVADIIDVTPSSAGLRITMPDARQGSTGFTALFTNQGADTYEVRDAGGNTILTVASGEAWNLYLRTNSTQAGTWGIFQAGAGTSTTNAAALAGAGLKAILTTLNTKIAISEKNANYVVVEADRAVALVWTGGSGTFTLPDPATLGSDWYVILKNSGSGSLTATPSAGTIDGSVSLVLGDDESTFVVSNGTNYFTVGLGQEVNSVFDFISLNVGGTGIFTLSGAQLNRISYRFTGVLMGNREIVVPAIIQQYWIDNQTTGAFTLTLKTAAGTGEIIPQGQRRILYCDGVNVVSAETFIVSTPVQIADGGTSATTAAGARTALGVPATTLTLTAGAGLTGGGDLSANRTFDVGAGAGITVNANDVALDTASTRNTDHAGVFISAGAGLTGGGDITASRTLDVGAGTGITVNANDVALDTASTRNTDHSAVSISGGTSLTGGGDITANRTITLVNDAASPGNNYYYGTDGGGTKGFHALPSSFSYRFVACAVDSSGTLQANSIGVTSVTHAATGTYDVDVTAAGFTNRPFASATPKIEANPWADNNSAVDWASSSNTNIRIIISETVLNANVNGGFDLVAIGT
jgi:hypothetical protein